MRLFQHDEFASIVTAAAAARSLDEAFVEKDYYITEILRIIAGRYQPGQVIFKVLWMPAPRLRSHEALPRPRREHRAGGSLPCCR
jgi:hypothetical protein